MMSQDNRLLPLPSEQLDRPLRDLAATPVTVPAVSTEQPHLRDYLAIVLKRKWLILSLVVIVTSLVTIHMYRMPSLYEAATQIKIEQKARSVVETGRGGGIQIRSNDPNYWNTQLQMLKTQKLARQVVMRLDLQNNPAFVGPPQGTGVIAGLRRLFSGGKAQSQAAAPSSGGGALPVIDEAELSSEQLTPEQAKQLEPYADALTGSLLIEPIDRTNLVNIHFVHTDPQIAANVANTLATVFSENDIRAETSGSQKAEDVLANQIIELQSRIRANEKARIEYKQRENIPLTDKPGADFVALRLSTYSTQLQQAEAERKDAESAYLAALETREKQGVWSIPAVISNDNIQKLRTRISELEQRRAELRVVYTEEWPEVIKIKKQVEELKKQLDKAPEEVFIGMKTRFEAAKKKERELRSAYFAERNQAAAQGIAGTGLTDLNQQIETDRQNLNLYQQRLNELRVTNGDRTVGNVSTVEEARVPREPIGPQRGRNIVVAFLLSLGVGIGLAFLLDYLDDSLKSVEDVDRHLHVPTLALIPAPREARRLLGRGPAEPAPAAANALTLISDVRSAAAEAYRHLRTSLLLSSAGQPPKTVLVTSSQPSEGKTTTAVNLATMLAQTGAEVLLLDCDLRRPRVHAHFGIPNTKGVTNFLSGDSDVGSLIQAYDKLPNLKIITSGPVPPNAAELLGSEEMRKLLYVLSEHFTHIVIDSPPAISFTDASILSTMVDGVMLVVHGGHTSRSTARRAKQQLQDVGAHLFGIVLNNVKLEGTDYYYSGYYAGYYATEEEDAPEGVEAAGAGSNGGGAR